MAELILRKDWSFERVDFADIKQYFSEDFIIVQIKDYDSNYNFSIGKVWVLPFLPGLGDTRFTSYEVGEGFNLIPNPKFSEQFRVIFQPFSKLRKVQLSIWRTNYMALISEIAAQGETITTIQSNVTQLQTVASQLQSSSARQIDFVFPAVQAKNSTYNFDFAILEHNLGDLRPSVVFYTDNGDAELLGYKVINANSIVINCKGASKAINNNWKAVITAGAPSPNPA